MHWYWGRCLMSCRWLQVEGKSTPVWNNLSKLTQVCHITRVRISLSYVDLHLETPQGLFLRVQNDSSIAPFGREQRRKKNPGSEPLASTTAARKITCLLINVSAGTTVLSLRNAVCLSCVIELWIKFSNETLNNRSNSWKRRACWIHDPSTSSN